MQSCKAIGLGLVVALLLFPLLAPIPRPAQATGQPEKHIPEEIPVARGNSPVPDSAGVPTSSADACAPVQTAEFAWEPITPTATFAVTFTATAWASGTAWVTETVDSGDWTGYFTSLALDSQGQPHISFYEWFPFDYTGQIQYAYFDGTAWVSETVAHYVGFPRAGATSLVLDAADHPHIAYVNERYDVTRLRYTWFDGTAWWVQTVDQYLGQKGGYASLALDATGQPHISYRRCKIDIDCELRYAWYDGSFSETAWRFGRAEAHGSTWQIEVLDSGLEAGKSPSLALDPANRPRIAYFNNPNLQYAFYEAAGTSFEPATAAHAVQTGGGFGSGQDRGYRQGWQIEIVDDLGGIYNSLVLDGNNHPHISYYSGIEVLRYAYHDGSSWITTTVDDQEEHTGRFSSLALDAAGRPHVSYCGDCYDEGGNADLRYAYYDGAWQIETVDAAGIVGRDTSLALDPAGRPHISYGYGPDNPYSPSELRYAWQAAPAPTPPVSYTWNLGDGTRASGAVVSHHYRQPGTYTVVLTATNCVSAAPGPAATSSVVVSHTVVVLPCTAITGTAFTWAPFTPTEGEAVTFTAAASGTPPLTFTWDLGDGIGAIGAVVSHTYATAGAYRVVLTATNCGGTASGTAVYTVTVQPCVLVHDPAFAWEPLAPVVDTPITFTAMATGTLPIGYCWDLGDGPPVEGAQIHYVYHKAGVYSVVLTATNCQSGTATIGHTITVYPYYQRLSNSPRP
jgi:PKD repeat protein